MSSTSPELPNTPKKVALIGSAASTKDLAPYNDTSWEIWGLAWRNDYPRCDVHFDIHPLTSDRKHILGSSIKEYVEVMRRRGTLHYLHGDAGLANATAYPLVQMVQWLKEKTHGQFDGKYLSCSIAYMLVFAMYSGAREIAIYGVDLIDDTEYVYQRPNLEYLIGIATTLGFQITIPKGCALMGPSWLYGYESPPSTDGPINQKILVDRLNQYKQQREKHLAALYTTDGAIQECQQLLDMLKHVRRGVDTN